MPLIQARGLVKHHAMGGGVVVRALQGVDVDVEEGAFLAILGRSGSGKSTLLNLIGGLDRPTSGSVTVAGEDLGALSSKARAAFRAQHVGFVFQSFHLQPRFLAWENVALPLVFTGVPRRTRRARALELLERVGLADRAHHRPTELSGGEQQRVALARSLVGEPRLLLGDEPTGNLDTATADAILALLQEVHAQGTTVVLVTHDRSLAETHASRRIELVDGRVAHDTADASVAGGSV